MCLIQVLNRREEGDKKGNQSVTNRPTTWQNQTEKEIPLAVRA